MSFWARSGDNGGRGRLSMMRMRRRRRKSIPGLLIPGNSKRWYNRSSSSLTLSILKNSAATKLLLTGALLVGTLGIAGCGGSDSNSGSTTGGNGKTIALLLPESKAARYEAQDRPRFEAKVKELCSDCKVLYSNADQDSAKQQQQAEAAITQGAKVLVLDPVDSASVTAIAKRAKDKEISVISYDRLISNAPISYYISFNNQRVGQLQARSLLDKLGKTADGKSIVMINGAPTDNNAKDFKKGALSVFDVSKINVAKTYDTPDWSPDKAQQQMEQAITAIGKDSFVGVYAANDATAGGAIAAMKAAGINSTARPVTGQDADLAGIQRIMVGQQYMTIYKAVSREATAAAQLAVALAKGEKPPAGLVNAKVNNGFGEIPSVLLNPIAVTKTNIKNTVVKDGFLKASDICAGNYKAACTNLGIR